MGAPYDIGSATTTDFKNKVPDFIVESMKLDIANSDGSETFVYYEKSTENYGYYFFHPTVASPINAMCTWAFGQGWATQDIQTKVVLEHISGNGKETFDTIIWNHAAVKYQQGDSFMEIIWNKSKTFPLNLINISPERVKTVFKGTRIIRYEIWNGKKWVTKNSEDMFHSMNKKIGDQNHGTSQIQSNKSVIDAGIEAFEDERTIKHRDKALGVVYYKTNNEGKIAFANAAIEKAVKDGEMVGLPENTAKIEPYPSKSSEDRQNWLGYVENLGYQTGGVPRSIVTSDGTSEVGGINGHLIFEVPYGWEQKIMENEFWAQLAIKIKWNRKPSLAPNTQENAEKNTGQLQIQPEEAAPKLNR